MNASEEDWLSVESLDLEAQGIAHRPDGKVVFVEGALPGEVVRVHTVRKKERWEQARMVDLRHESALRVTPGCTVAVWLPMTIQSNIERSENLSGASSGSSESHFTRTPSISRNASSANRTRFCSSTDVPSQALSGSSRQAR